MPKPFLEFFASQHATQWEQQQQLPPEQRTASSVDVLAIVCPKLSVITSFSGYNYQVGGEIVETITKDSKRSQKTADIISQALPAILPAYQEVRLHVLVSDVQPIMHKLGTELSYPEQEALFFPANSITAVLANYLPTILSSRRIVTDLMRISTVIQQSQKACATRVRESLETHPDPLIKNAWQEGAITLVEHQQTSHLQVLAHYLALLSDDAPLLDQSAFPMEQRIAEMQILLQAMAQLPDINWPDTCNEDEFLYALYVLDLIHDQRAFNFENDSIWLNLQGGSKQQSAFIEIAVEEYYPKIPSLVVSKVGLQ